MRQFQILVGRLQQGATEQSLIIKGLRGAGKTVLLNAFEDIAEGQGFLTYYHEAPRRIPASSRTLRGTRSEPLDA